MQETKKCLYCDKEFLTEGSDIICKKFCCRSCSDNYRRRLIKPYKIITVKCLQCGNEFNPKYGYEEKTKFCCKKCKNIFIKNRLGKEHYNKLKKNFDKKIMDDEVLHSIHLADKRLKSKQPSYRFLSYKKEAIRRFIDFNLSFEQFLTFWNKPCHYCGSEIEGVGIDRIDNSVGYQINNCVPCCKTCNTMKMIMSVSDFLSHIQKIINHTAQV